MLKETFLNLIAEYSDNETYNIKCWSEIEKKYSSKSRYYHNLGHIKNMIDELNEIESMVNDLDTLLFTVYYHDIIYKATKSDNEYKSALFFEKRISQTDFMGIKKVMKQIELTKEHKKSDDNDTNILLDLDFAVLGLPLEEYRIYYENIRREYKVFPDFMYKKGRIKALMSFLDSDYIFKTDYFINKYEKQARANINYELKYLSE